jgi:hypothetical protein
MLHEPPRLKCDYAAPSPFPDGQPRPRPDPRRRHHEGRPERLRGVQQGRASAISKSSAAPSKPRSPNSCCRCRSPSNAPTACSSATASPPRTSSPPSTTACSTAHHGDDLKRRTGAVYQLIWGRKTSRPAPTSSASASAAKLVVTGHQPQEGGYLTNGEHHLIIASEHNQGVFLAANLTEEYDMEKLVSALRKFVSVDL